MSFNKRYSVRAVQGFHGIERISSSALCKLPGLRDYESPFRQIILYLEKRGYVRNETLFAFPYDWRQDVTGPFVQSAFADLISSI